MIVVPDHIDHLWKELDDGPVRVHSGVLIMRLRQLIDEPELAEIDLAKGALVGEPS